MTKGDELLKTEVLLGSFALTLDESVKAWEMFFENVSKLFDELGYESVTEKQLANVYKVCVDYQLDQRTRGE